MAMESRKKVSTTVYITQEQNAALKMLNQKTKVPIAEYIREGIDLVLDKHKQQLPGQMLLLQDEFDEPRLRGPRRTQQLDV